MSNQASSNFTAVAEIRQQLPPAVKSSRPRSAAARFKEVIECWQNARIEALGSKPSAVQLPGWFFEELCRQEFDANLSVDVFVATYTNRETGYTEDVVCDDVPFVSQPGMTIEYSAFVFPTQDLILDLEALLPDYWKEIEFKDSRKRTFCLPTLASDSAIRNGVAKLKQLANGAEPKEQKQATPHPPRFVVIIEENGIYTVKAKKPDGAVSSDDINPKEMRPQLRALMSLVVSKYFQSTFARAANENPLTEMENPFDWTDEVDLEKARKVFVAISPIVITHKEIATIVQEQVTRRIRSDRKSRAAKHSPTCDASHAIEVEEYADRSTVSFDKKTLDNCRSLVRHFNNFWRAAEPKDRKGAWLKPICKGGRGRRRKEDDFEGGWVLQVMLFRPSKWRDD